MSGTKGKLRYREEQRQHPLTAYALPVGLVLPILVVFAVVPYIEPSEEPVPVIAWVVAVGAMILALLQGKFLKLTTEVRATGLLVRPWPRGWKQVPLDNVVRHAVVTFRPFRDYMNVPVSKVFRLHVYCIRGNRGVRIDYADGSHALIGSRNPESLNAAIGRLLRERG
jgi:hypothetical protein